MNFSKKIPLLFFIISISINLNAQASLHVSSYDTEDPVIVGTTTNFLVEVRNEGIEVCSYVQPQFILPENMEFVSAKGGDFRLEQDKVIFSESPSMEPGSLLKYVVNARVIRPGVHKFRADIQFDQSNKSISVEESNTAVKSLAEKPAALHVSSYETEDPIRVDGKTIYVIEIRNEGISDIHNLQLSNVIAAEMELIEVKAPVFFSMTDKKIHFAPLKKLEPAKKVSYRITLRALRPGISINQAQVTADIIKAPIIHEESTTINR